MTSPAPAPAKSGMPKWLIILLVIFLIIVLGCCGGFATCVYLGKKAAISLRDAATQNSIQIQQDIQQRIADQQRRVEEQARNASGISPTPSDGAAGGPSGASPERTITQELGVGKPPANFPDDIPLMSGLTASPYSIADKIKGSGAATFSGKIKHADATSYYEKQMAAQGWKIEANTDVGAGTFMSFIKGARKANISITTDTDNITSLVTISYETTQ